MTYGHSDYKIDIDNKTKLPGKVGFPERVAILHCER